MHINKENVDKLLRLRNLRYRQTPCNLKRVKAHANGVNNLLKFLDYVLSILAIFRLQESKVDVQSMSLVYGVMFSFCKGYRLKVYELCFD